MCPGKFSNMVLQALIALVKKVPPKGKRLLVIGTTSRKDVLDDMGLLSAFNSSFHLSNITKGEEVVTVVKASISLFIFFYYNFVFEQLEIIEPWPNKISHFSTIKSLH